MFFDILKKLFSREVEISTHECNHDDIISDYDGPSTTRVVLILTASSVLVFSVGYMIRPVLDLVREVYRDNKNFKDELETLEPKHIEIEDTDDIETE